VDLEGGSPTLPTLEWNARQRGCSDPRGYAQNVPVNHAPSAPADTTQRVAKNVCSRLSPLSRGLGFDPAPKSPRSKPRRIKPSPLTLPPVCFLSFAVALSLVLVTFSLHALDWQPGNGYRRAPVSPAQPGKTGFVLLPGSDTGITFTNVLPQKRYLTNQIYLNGGGVAAGDVDGDGWCDLFFCGLDRPSVLYRNLGNWKFQDITASAGVGCTNTTCTGATFADIDGDGDLDLLVNTCGSGTLIFINDGKGHFTNPTPNAPLNYLRGGTSLALADIDGDGDLDLYVANYRTSTIRDMPNSKFTIKEIDGNLVVTAFNGRPTTEADLVGRFSFSPGGRYKENGEPDVLYVNDGKGHFAPVSFTGGAFLDEDGRPLQEPPYDWGLTASFRDLNGDGAPDIYVCNDFESPDRIWINNGKGQFQAISRLALRQTSLFSMGVDFADINRDGFDEIFVSDMLSRSHAKRMVELGDIRPTVLPIGAIENRPQYSHNTLFFNRGDGTFAEISQYARVQASEWTWSPNFLDVDLDGYEDVLITTGHELQMMNADVINRAEMMRSQKQMTKEDLLKLNTLFPRYAIPSAAFRNRGDLTFEDVSDQWGFNIPAVANALALVDLDNDGDLDAVVNNLNGPAEIYRNEGGAPRVGVRLKGLPPNTQGIGARLKVRGGPVPLQTQEVVCGGRYLSGNDPMRVFAAGGLTNRLTIEVTWRSGKQSVVTNVLPNSIYEIDEAAAPSLTDHVPAPTSPAPLFADVSSLIGHTHHEDPYDDFERQPLLPNALSQLGPGISWVDIDGDGWEDLFIGGGRGGLLAGFRNLGNGTFTPMTNAPLARRIARDQTTLLGLGSTLLVGSSNYEDGQTNGGYLRIYDLQQQRAGESILNPSFSTGPLAMGDIDNDGDLDLFIGGRVLPGRYPEAAPSLLLKNDGGRFTPSQSFDRLGLVSGAVFSDLDGDGIPEIILACEWGPVRVFRMRDGAYKEVTKELGLAGFTGWWNGVATGDFDGDGRLDIVASNWGLNTKYRPTPQQPIRIYYGDFAGNGAVDIIEACFDPATGKEVPNRGLRAVSAAMPFVQERIQTFAAYGEASLQEIYGDKLKTAGVVEANTLASMVFLNRGDHFEAAPLPMEAQWAPAFGICVADMDGNGTEDIFLSQNFFAVNPEDWRHDAGRGLWLRGDGHGKFEAVPGQESGVAVYGEQRGCAACDFDGDGRVDLAVTQNGNATKLYQNRGARPGLRVRLLGPPGNPNGVGACLRLKYGERLGPAREIQAGSGYWSQNSMVQVMATPEAPTHLWVRWPGGKTTTTALSAGAKEISVDPGGALKVR